MHLGRGPLILLAGCRVGPYLPQVLGLALSSTGVSDRQRLCSLSRLSRLSPVSSPFRIEHLPIHYCRLLSNGTKPPHFPQVYQDALADYHLAASGMPYLLAQPSPVTNSTVRTPELFTGLELSLPNLDRVGFFSNMSVSGEIRRKRESAFDHWLEWSNRFPMSIRPSLITCSPHEMACFLEQWRASRIGRRKATDPPNYLPDISPHTLRSMSSQMSGLCLSSGRRPEAWTPGRKEGNPLNSSIIRNYLNGYEFYSFKHTPYTEAGAVPVTLDLFLKLMAHLISEAELAPTSYSRALLLRDATFAAYLWETGQRGKEGSELVLTDFSYADIRCTPAWRDLVSGELSSLDPLIVESSNGTKSRKTKHPGTLELQLVPSEEDGGGFLVSLIPLYEVAMRAAGSPLTHNLFKTSYCGTEVFSEGQFTSDAFNKRLQKHLQDMGEWNGESAHGLRRGSTQLLRAHGASASEIAELRLWRRDTTVDLYLHLSRHKARLVPKAPATTDGLRAAPQS